MERDHQAALCRWARTQESNIPELKLLYAVFNGAHLAGGKLSGWRAKQEGLRPGVPDLCLPVPRGRYHSLYIEMKDESPNARTSNEQKAWHAALRDQGHAVAVCHGWLAAKAMIERYFALDSVKLQEAA